MFLQGVNRIMILRPLVHEVVRHLRWLLANSPGHLHHAQVRAAWKLRKPQAAAEAAPEALRCCISTSAFFLYVQAVLLTVDHSNSLVCIYMQGHACLHGARDIPDTAVAHLYAGACLSSRCQGYT